MATERGIADHLAWAADWIKKIRLRRRLEYERATRSRPDYGSTSPSINWFLITDQLLAAIYAPLRLLTVIGYVVGILLTIGLLYVVLSMLGIIK
jgi:hypothetical protein